MKKMKVMPNRWMWDTRTRVAMLMPSSFTISLDTSSWLVSEGRCGLAAALWHMMQRVSMMGLTLAS